MMLNSESGCGHSWIKACLDPTWGGVLSCTRFLSDGGVASQSALALRGLDLVWPCGWRRDRRYNRLVKTLARTADVIPQRWVGMDIDAVVCHLQLRAKRLPETDRAHFPLHVRLGIGIDNGFWDSVSAFLEEYMLHNKKPLKLAKRLVIAIANGASEENWAKDKGVVIDRRKRAAHQDSEGSRLLAEWKAECKRYHQLMERRHPDLHAHFVAKADKEKDPAVQTTCALDSHDEAGFGDHLAGLAAQLRGVRLCSGEHDGFFFWFTGQSAADIVEAAQRLTGFVFAHKPLDAIPALGVEKHCAEDARALAETPGQGHRTSARGLSEMQRRFWQLAAALRPFLAGMPAPQSSRGRSRSAERVCGCCVAVVARTSPSVVSCEAAQPARPAHLVTNVGVPAADALSKK